MNDKQLIERRIPLKLLRYSSIQGRRDTNSAYKMPMEREENGARERRRAMWEGMLRGLVFME